MNQPVSDVFGSFGELAQAAGLAIDGITHVEDFGSRTLRAAVDSAELRLCWDGKEEYLSLEISHGLPTGEQFGWLELFGAPCKGGLVPAVKDKSEGIEDAIQYGIELMSIRQKST